MHLGYLLIKTIFVLCGYFILLQTLAVYLELNFLKYIYCLINIKYLFKGSSKNRIVFSTMQKRCYHVSTLFGTFLFFKCYFNILMRIIFCSGTSHSSFRLKYFSFLMPNVGG